MPLFDAGPNDPRNVAHLNRVAFPFALAVVTAMAATQIDWGAAWDHARALAPTATERYEWTGTDLTDAPPAQAGLTEGIDDPATASSAHLSAEGVTVDLVWEPDLTLVAVRAETYSDAFGTGLRLAIATDTDTTGGPDCLTARAHSATRTLDLQWCTRADRHDPVDMAAFLGKRSTTDWAPDTLFLTQTANLDADATLIDYYGLGAHTGNAFDTGLWPVGTWPGTDHPATEDCANPALRLRLPDLHLTDHYDDPAAHQWHLEEVHDTGRAFPAEDRLLMPACASTAAMGPAQSLVVKPLTLDGTIPLATAIPYRASTDTVHPVRTAIAVDARSCDADLPDCTADDEHGTWWVNNTGPAGAMLGQLLEAP